jgi:hypothetical protein
LLGCHKRKKHHTRAGLTRQENILNFIPLWIYVYYASSSILMVCLCNLEVPKEIAGSGPVVWASLRKIVARNVERNPCNNEQNPRDDERNPRNTERIPLLTQRNPSETDVKKNSRQVQLCKWISDNAAARHGDGLFGWDFDRKMGWGRILTLRHDGPDGPSN